jgi:hypothetical protein
MHWKVRTKPPHLHRPKVERQQQDQNDEREHKVADEPAAE